MNSFLKKYILLTNFIDLRTVTNKIALLFIIVVLPLLLAIISESIIFSYFLSFVFALFYYPMVAGYREKDNTQNKRRSFNMVLQKFSFAFDISEKNTKKRRYYGFQPVLVPVACFAVLTFVFFVPMFMDEPKQNIIPVSSNETSGDINEIKTFTPFSEEPPTKKNILPSMGFVDYNTDTKIYEFTGGMYGEIVFIHLSGYEYRFIAYAENYRLSGQARIFDDKIFLQSIYGQSILSLNLKNKFLRGPIHFPNGEILINGKLKE